MAIDILTTRTVCLSIVLFSCIVSLSAQQDTTRLRFEDFPVPKVFTGRPKPIDLSSHPHAREYRTELRRQAKEGPNFAGHYTIAVWGCGTSCQAFAIVDALNGRIYFSDQLPFVSWGGWRDKDYGLHYRLDSNLLMVYGRRMEEDPSGIFYYLWKGDKLDSIKSIPKESELPGSLK